MMARIASERGRMKSEDELCIQKHILEIEDTIEAKELTGPLFTRKIIDLNDMDFIQSGETRSERSRRFLSVIVMRGANAFHGFVSSLETMGYRELADKLKGSWTGTTHGLTASLKDEAGANGVSINLNKLTRRVDTIEQTKATHGDLSILRNEVSGALHDLTYTLSKIEELSKVSRETENTINFLQKQLEEKEQLLASARDQIMVLESKVSDLEKENLTLRGQMQALRLKVEKNKDDNEAQREQDRKEREQDRRETKKRFEKLERESQTKQNQLMDVVHTLVKQVTESNREGGVPRHGGAHGFNVRKKPIVSKNRFQTEGR